MPQIIIDTATESAASKRLLARLLTDYAALDDARDSQAATEYPPLTPDPDPAQVFGKPVVPTGASNVLPFPVPGTSNPSAPSVVLPAASVPALVPSPEVASTSTTAPSIAISAATPAAVPIASGTPASPAPTPEYDSAGVPWDARIHQSGKSKKTDGTWKIQKGIETKSPGLVAAVLAELVTVKSTPTPTVTVPPVTNTLPLPIAPGTPAGIPPTGAALPVANGGLPLPAAPAASALPAPPNPIALFQAMMKKISDGLAVAQFTQPQVQAAHVGLGLPQLQLAITRPELIPQIEAALGL